MNDTFGMQEALKELGLKDINERKALRVAIVLLMAQLLESYSPVDGQPHR